MSRLPSDRSGAVPGGGAVVLLVLLLVAGCGGGEGRGDLRVGGPAPSFTALDLEGDSVTLEEYRGSPTILNVWATWCAPCRFETPFLQALYEKHRAEGLELVGVSVDQRGQGEDIREFLDEHGVTYDILLDPSMSVADTYYVLGLPATFIIDRSGILRLVHHGPVGEESTEFLRTLRGVLEEEGGEGPSPDAPAPEGR